MPPAEATTISPPPVLATEEAGGDFSSGEVSALQTDLCSIPGRSCLFCSAEWPPSPHQAHLLGSCPGGQRDVIPGGMGLNGGIVPTRSRGGSGRDRAETGNVSGATQAGFVLLLLLLPPPPSSLPPSPPMWPLPSHSHPDHRPSPGPLLRFLHCLGQCSCCGRWGSGWPWAVLRSKVSSQNDSALWSWVSVWVGPVLPAQLVWPWHPCPGSTLSGPCPGPVPSSPCAIQTQPNLDKWVAEWMD